jgi:radical SAM superfamily enzyme YgiQ (UPF0313 family)
MPEDIKLALVNIKGRDMASPPLGLAYLATYVRQYLPHLQVRVVDINFEDPFQTVVDFQPDLVGISSITMHYNAAVQLAEKIRERLGVPLILGGVHISTCPNSFSPVFDVAVLGEGELTFLDLLKLYDQRREFTTEDLKTIPGLLFSEDGHLQTTAPRPQIKDLDTIPIPDRSYFNQHYFGPIPIPALGDEVHRSTPIMTARGCPFKCVFCSTSAFWKRVRMHSVEYVAEEVKYLAENFGISHIKIWDDTVFGKKRLRELRKALHERDVLGKVKFTCQLTASLVDDELCELMQEVGFVSVGIGFESGSERILQYLKGGAVTVEQNLRAVEICKRHDIYVMGSLMMGTPGETLDDMQQTLDFIDAVYELGADQIHFFTTQPFPGTELWRYGVEEGIIDADFDFDHTSKYDADEPMFLDEDVDLEDFRRMYKLAQKKIARFPAHSLGRRLRLLVMHPVSAIRSVRLRLKNYSLFGVRMERLRKRVQKYFGSA